MFKMDRSWMLKDRRSKEQEDGVDCFIAFAVQNSTKTISIRCPCSQCGNIIFQTPQKIKEHLFFHGIDQTYRTWYWHGEVSPSGPPTTRAKQYNKLQFDDQHSMVEIIQATHDNYLNDPELFARLMKNANKPLYPGCRNFK